MSSQFQLLTQRRFAPFFVVQFLSALNDNVLKNAIVILIAFNGLAIAGLGSDVMVNLAAGVFILPFFLFSAISGQLADKYEKSNLIRWIFLFEIGVMGVGLAGLARREPAWLLLALFLAGLRSTLFGPVKYAILPQQLRPEELTGGNGLVEMGTFVAILIGTVAGGVLIAADNGPWRAGIAAIVLAVTTLAVAFFIPRARAADATLELRWNPFTETWRNIQFARRNRAVFLSLLGISWFWFYGALMLSQFPSFAKNVLGGSESVVTLLLTLFSIGIGIGSMLCERLSGHKVEIGLVPFGSIGMTIFGIDLFFAIPSAPAVGMGWLAFVQDPAHWRLIFDLVMLGLFGGLYIVPLYALVQIRSEPTQRSRIIAANNILNALFMVAAALIAAGLLAAHLTIPQLLLAAAIMNALVAIYIYTLVPEFLMRFLCWLLIHSVYRVKKEGLERIPEEGPCVVVANHVSFVDALIIMGCSPRPIRFVMDHNIFKVPLLNFVFREARAIPIAPRGEDPQRLEQAYDEVARALEAGEVVGLFPEGRITDTGELAPFKGGIQRIVHRTPVPVVPIALQGLWGSFFSRKGGAAMTRPFRRGAFSRIGMVVGRPFAPEEVSPERLHNEVHALLNAWR